MKSSDWVAFIALAFAVSSFWYMNWRRGKLHLSTPRNFAALGTNGGRAIIELPLAFYNDGPLPIIIEDLLLFLPETELNEPFELVATVTKLLSPKGDRFVGRMKFD